MRTSLLLKVTAGVVCALGMSARASAQTAAAPAAPQPQLDRTVLPIPQPILEPITEPDARKAQMPAPFSSPLL